MTVVIAFISLNSDHRFIVTVGSISSNDVLVYVYIFFHVILSVVRWPVYQNTPFGDLHDFTGPHLVSVASRPALHFNKCDVYFV